MSQFAPPTSPERHIPRATYFLTIRLAERRSDLLLHQINVLRHAMRATLNRHPFRIDAITVLPATLHMIWRLPAGDDTCPARIAMLKSRFSRGCPMPPHRSLAQIQRGEKGIWQRRHWEHVIGDADDLARHRRLIYLAPVHAGLCTQPQDWPHSSLHRDLRQGQAAATAFRGETKITASPRRARPVQHCSQDHAAPAGT